MKTVTVGVLVEEQLEFTLSDLSRACRVERQRLVALVEAGVLDPAKVTRTALQNAASVASLILTTEAIVAELPEDKAPAAAGGPPGGFGGGEF